MMMRSISTTTRTITAAAIAAQRELEQAANNRNIFKHYSSSPFHWSSYSSSLTRFGILCMCTLYLAHSPLLLISQSKAFIIWSSKEENKNRIRIYRIHTHIGILKSISHLHHRDRLVRGR